MVRRPKPDESESERQNESAKKVETIAPKYSPECRKRECRSLNQTKLNPFINYSEIVQNSSGACLKPVLRAY